MSTHQKRPRPARRRLNVDELIAKWQRGERPVLRREHVTDLVVQYTKEPRNNVSHRITSAVETGKLRSLGGKFPLADVLAWCSLPSLDAAFGIVLGRGAVKPTHDRMIKVAAKGQRKLVGLRKCREEIRRLDSELAAANAEIERLRPLADKWVNWMNKKRRRQRPQ